MREKPPEFLWEKALGLLFVPRLYSCIIWCIIAPGLKSIESSFYTCKFINLGISSSRSSPLFVLDRLIKFCFFLSYAIFASSVKWREHWPARIMWKPSKFLPSSVIFSPTLTFLRFMRFRHSVSSLPLNLCFLISILYFNICKMVPRSESVLCSLAFERDLISWFISALPKLANGLSLTLSAMAAIFESLSSLAPRLLLPGFY